jgi:ATP-binding cassette subfamily B protein
VVAASDTAGFIADHGVELLLFALLFVVIRPGLMALMSALNALAITPGLFHLSVWRLHRHTLGHSLRYFEEDFAGRITQKQTQTANAVGEVVSETIHAIAFGIAAVVGSAVALGGADWRLAILMLVWLAGYGWAVAYFLPRIRARAKRRAEARAALSGQLVDTLSHMETVKLFAHAEREEEAARGALARYRAAALSFGRMAFGFRAALAVLSGLLPFMLIGGGLWLWMQGQAGPGLLAMAGFLSMRLGQMSGWISFTAMGIFSNIGVIEDGMRTLAPPHDLVDHPEAVEPPHAAGAIAFEDVHFRYGREDGGGLDGFALRVAPGEKVALVGRSGAGKSTVVSLLLRLHDVEEGRITLDGADIRDLTQDGLRRQIATVTQEPAMFNRSALDNILYGRPDAGREAAEAAAREAQADEFIAELSDYKGREGYDAHLGERGVKLSGGQRQRIALARAILKSAPVLVLDEATSALDSESEAAIQAALWWLMEGKTVIAIAHRLSTIARMDRIVVMDAGRVVEEGTHQELLARGGLYAGFWGRQSDGFIGLEAAE